MIWAMFLVFVVIFIWAMPLEKKIIFSMFWAMPSARATPGSLTLGYCFAMNQALRIPIAIFW